MVPSGPLSAWRATPSTTVMSPPPWAGLGSRLVAALRAGVLRLAMVGVVAACAVGALLPNRLKSENAWATKGPPRAGMVRARASARAASLACDFLSIVGYHSVAVSVFGIVASLSHSRMVWSCGTDHCTPWGVGSQSSRIHNRG